MKFKVGDEVAAFGKVPVSYDVTRPGVKAVVVEIKDDNTITVIVPSYVSNPDWEFRVESKYFTLASIVNTKLFSLLNEERE